MLTVEPHEVRTGDAVLRHQSDAVLLEQAHVLAAAEADRLNQPPALDELGYQRRGHARERCCDDDRVKRFACALAKPGGVCRLDSRKGRAANRLVARSLGSGSCGQFLVLLGRVHRVGGTSGAREHQQGAASGADKLLAGAAVHEPADGTVAS